MAVTSLHRLEVQVQPLDPAQILLILRAHVVADTSRVDVAHRPVPGHMDDPDGMAFDARLSHRYRASWLRPHTNPTRQRGDRRGRRAGTRIGPSLARRVGIRQGSEPRPDRSGSPA